MNFDDIMEQITSKLTGDYEEDANYLQQQMDLYKDHPLSKEITRACSRLLIHILPENEKKELDQLMANKKLSWDSILEEVHFNQYKGNYDKALELIESLVGQVNGLFEDDSVSEYHCFNELFEMILYDYLQHPTKDVRQPDNFPMADIYSTYGSVLIDLGRINDAQMALSEAIRWNPMSCAIAFEYIETLKKSGDMDAFFDHTLEVFQFAFKRKDIGRCYRNLGYYFIEKELWDEAVACFLLSLEFDEDSKMAQSELYYIQSTIQDAYREPSFEEIEKYSKVYDFPIGADDDVIGLAYTLGCQYNKKHEPKLAKYFLQIAYDLTEDEDILNELNT